VYYIHGAELMKLIFAVLDVSSTVGLTRCYKTEGFYAFIFNRDNVLKTYYTSNYQHVHLYNKRKHTYKYDRVEVSLKSTRRARGKLDRRSCFYSMVSAVCNWQLPTVTDVLLTSLMHPLRSTFVGKVTKVWWLL